MRENWVAEGLLESLRVTDARIETKREELATFRTRERQRQRAHGALALGLEGVK